MANIGPTLSKYVGASEFSNLLESDKFGIYAANTYLELDGVADDYSALYALINTTINGADAEIWFKDGTCLIGTSITIPSNIKLVFLNGGILKPDTGVTITGNYAKIEAGIQQIFDISSGTVTGSWNTEVAYPQWMGAVGDGSTDDTAEVQSAITNFRNIKIPKSSGNYMINAVTRLQMTSYRTITWEDGATFEVIANAEDDYRCINISDDSYVTLYNPRIIGDRTGHTGVTGEQGHGIVITGSSNYIKIYNAICNDCWGNGIIVYGGNNIYIENPSCDNNRRAGMSITNVTKIDIINPKFTNTNGVAPECGLDIEPNYDTDELKNIHITNMITEDNDGAGLTLNMSQLVGVSHNVNIQVDGHKDNGSLNGLSIYTMTYDATPVTGKVVISDANYINSVEAGITQFNYSGTNTPEIQVLNPSIINANAGGSVDSYSGSAICLFRDNTVATTYTLGNIHIINPMIIDNRTPVKLLRGVYCEDTKSVYFANTSIVDPIKCVGLATTDMFDIRPGQTCTDKFGVTNIRTTANLAYTCYSRMHNKISAISPGAGDLLITLGTTNVLDTEMTFVNEPGTIILRITPPALSNIVPLSATVGKYIQTTVAGSSITLRRVTSTKYVVVNQIGTWTVEP